MYVVVTLLSIKGNTNEMNYKQAVTSCIITGYIMVGWHLLLFPLLAIIL